MPKLRTTGPASTPLAGRIKAARDLLGWSQAELAEKAGFDRVKAVDLESGKNKASTSGVREALARAFGVSLERITSFINGDLGDGKEAAELLLAKEAPKRTVDLEEPWRALAISHGEDPDDPDVSEVYRTAFHGYLEMSGQFAKSELSRRRAAAKGKAPLGVRELEDDDRPVGFGAKKGRK